MTAAPGSDVQERRLYVSWRDPNGSIHPIGILVRRPAPQGDHYTFAYLKLAERLDEFTPLPGFPDLHRRYDSEVLFPVFANRAMPRTRPEFDALAARVELSGDADPFEVMARSGGRRATDRIEVFSGPAHTRDGRASTLFFVRGIRHVSGAEEAVGGLVPGDRLVLVDDPANEYNPRAVLLRVSDGRQVGWVPDYLVEHIHELRDLNHAEPSVTVEHVNDESAPPHLRLLCRLDAPWPSGYEPFSDARFQPLASLG
jgi:hypothetical protein